MPWHSCVKNWLLIRTEVPVSCSYEEFRLKDVYTKEAYEIFKKLNFKNLLVRFDPAQINENSMEQDFFTCNDLDGCEALFEKAGKQERVGCALLGDKEGVYGLGLVLDEDGTFIIFRWRE